MLESTPRTGMAPVPIHTHYHQPESPHAPPSSWSSPGPHPTIKTIWGHSLLAPPAPPSFNAAPKKIKAENPRVLLFSLSPMPSWTLVRTPRTARHTSVRYFPVIFFTKSECKSTPSHTQRLSPTSALTAPSPSPKSPTWPSTCASTWVCCPTTAPTIISLSYSSSTPSSTPESILVTDCTSAHILTAEGFHSVLQPPVSPTPAQRQVLKVSQLLPSLLRLASPQIYLLAHAIKHAKAYCCSTCELAYTSETYLMKHMSKRTMVEHLVNHRSPQRTESPGVPVPVTLV
ncbi:zinc finger protein 362-like [Nannospalax galili]|uniref:zinc finger protein 362-like n=1 Tax=Nannospalax galili TaxID=1026970 RepID=UPI00111C298F|nr:zinc finger protein 362-like [Nannospalax galili]